MCLIFFHKRNLTRNEKNALVSKFNANLTMHLTKETMHEDSKCLEHAGLKMLCRDEIEVAFLERHSDRERGLPTFSWVNCSHACIIVLLVLKGFQKKTSV